MILAAGVFPAALALSAGSGAAAGPSVASPAPAAGGQAAGPRRVWLDVDPAVMRGGHEPDDGIALVLAFASPEVAVAGVGVVFGNAPLDRGVPIARELAARFGPPGLAIHPGAAGPSLDPTPASRAIVEALEAGPLAVAALGPATNLAAALRERPALASRLESVVLVVGRRAEGPLVFPGGGPNLPDFNFELDPAAVEAVLASGAPVTLVPFEFAAAVPITAEDWAPLWDTPFGAAFRGPVEDYLDWFEEHTSRRATYPFDSFALARLIAPGHLECDPARVAVRQGPADTPQDAGPTKPWLVRLETDAPGDTGRPVIWCHTPTPALEPFLLRRLAGLAAR